MCFLLYFHSHLIIIAILVNAIQRAMQGTGMNGVHQSGNNGDFEKTFPGCLGRMVNLFDLNVGMAGNRLLTAKPYRDGAYSF